MRIAIVAATALVLASCQQQAPTARPESPAPESSAPESAEVAGTFELLGFSGHEGEGPGPPDDAVQAGGTWGSCRVADLAKLFAFVDFEGASDGVPASYHWTFEGTEVQTESFAWDYGTSGRTSFFVDRGGEELEDGRWSFELRIDGVPVVSGDVVRVTQYC